MNDTAASPQAPRVRYDRSLRLTVPIIADRATFDEFHERVRITGGIGLRAIAGVLGIRPPSTMHTWSVGWAPYPDSASARLVWYDPSKLGLIDQKSRAALQDCPEGGEITVAQGLGWDEIDIRITTSGPAGASDGEETVEPAAAAFETVREGEHEPQQHAVEITAGDVQSSSGETGRQAGEGAQ